MARQAVRVKMVGLQAQTNDFPHQFAKGRFAETFGCENILQVVVQNGRSRQGVSRQGRNRSRRQLNFAGPLAEAARSPYLAIRRVLGISCRVAFRWP